MNETTNASALFAPIWRRKWLILVVAVLVAAGTYLYYRHQSVSYEASTQIYLGAGQEEQITATGTVSSGRRSTLEPSAQATLINSPIIRTEVRKELKKQHKTKAARQALKGKVKAKAREKNEFITIGSEARGRRGALLLANLTAQTYVRRENGNYRQRVEGAIAITRREMRRITASQEAAAAAETVKSSSKSAAPAKGKSTNTSNALQLANLASKLNQLEGNLAVQSVKQVSPAVAKAISTSPKRAAVFGFLIGLVLASILAYVLARFDPRLHSLAEIEAAFGAEILTALPPVRHPIVADASGSRPSRQLYEPLGRLQTSLQVAAPVLRDGQPARPRTVLFTSAESGDGQSSVVAGLALVERDAGASVAVVEADLRRPGLARLLGVGERPGLADVLTGQLAIGEAVQGIGGAVRAVAGAGHHVAPPTPVAVEAPPTSSSVLVGTPVENPSALLASAAMADTLRALAGMHEHVLVDAPPPLEVGDAIPLLSLVDAVVIVARAGQTREASARRLVQVLRRMSTTPVLGVVVNSVSARDSKRYGFSAYRAGGWRGRRSR